MKSYFRKSCGIVAISLLLPITSFAESPDSGYSFDANNTTNQSIAYTSQLGPDGDLHFLQKPSDPLTPDSDNVFNIIGEGDISPSTVSLFAEGSTADPCVVELTDTPIKGDVQIIDPGKQNFTCSLSDDDSSVILNPK